MSAEPLLVREATPDDIAFIMGTWVASHIFAFRDRRRAWEASSFRRNYVNVVLGRPHRMVVLCSPNAQTALHGHAIATNEALAWVYVTKDLRGNGYAKQLVKALMGDRDVVPVHRHASIKPERFEFHMLKGKCA